MSYLLFVDESGQDRRASPYEVLAGVAVQDRDLWNLVLAIQQLEVQTFGQRYAQGDREIKGRKLLDRKTFQQAQLFPPFGREERVVLSRQCLTQGAGALPQQYAALAQAKLDFVRDALTTCAQHRCCAFASIVAPSAARSASGALRKDYAFLFERYFGFLEDRSREDVGLVVFDELERAQSHVLVDQMSRYFQDTYTGRTRAVRVVPEPFFVHSHLTTMVQIADIVAQVISWALRLRGMDRPARNELADYVQLIRALRYDTVRPWEGHDDFRVWGFVYLNDLRPRAEQRATDGEPEAGR